MNEQSALPVVDPSSLPAWPALEAHRMRLADTTIRDLLADSRDDLRIDASGMSFDFSRQRVDSAVIEDLIGLADQCGVERLRDAMFAGEQINTTEGRSVLHAALRQPRTSATPGSGPLVIDGRDVNADVHEVLDRMSVFAEDVRNGQWRGSTGETITDIVNIGIGGSDLGPAMAHRALAGFVKPGLRCHFVSNVDPADLDRMLETIDPARTLIIVASKTFTTQETMANAQRMRSRMVDHLGADCVPRHFVAVSTNADAVKDFGIDLDNMFGFWDWVGGRYSMGSAIGLSTMIAIGPVNFRAMLDGFHSMDVHFTTAPAYRNVPLLMGLLSVWNRNFLDIATTAVLPYSHDLSRFPAYLQQLTMESNGKGVRRDGSPINYPTGGIYWGEPGTNGQHSFYQLLHQGTDDVASDIIILAEPTVDTKGEQDGENVRHQHDMLVANALAQASVLALGRTEAEVRGSDVPDELVAHKVMPGNRPVSVVMIPSLTPFSLGALISAYEHSVFTQGAIWQVNSFDQWGVELGKSVANGILADIESGTYNDPNVDAATRHSLHDYLRMRSSN